MYLDFEDYRPETPRIGSVISAREGVLLSIIFHLGMLLLILHPPDWLARQEGGQITVFGKGGKTRYVPLHPGTNDAVRANLRSGQLQTEWPYWPNVKVAGIKAIVGSTWKFNPPVAFAPASSSVPASD